MSESLLHVLSHVYILVDQLDECFEKLGVCPRIPRIVLQSETT